MNAPRPPFRDAEIDALEARFALRVCSRLNEAPATLPHDITERLRVARLRAVEQAARPQTTIALAHAPGELATSAGSLGGGSDGSSHAWLKLASALPLLVLLAGLALIHYFDELERIDAAAEVDAALLADDLPPQAYADPGFAEFMNDSQSRE